MIRGAVLAGDIRTSPARIGPNLSPEIGQERLHLGSMMEDKSGHRKFLF
jgi:hypothetical protein